MTFSDFVEKVLDVPICLGVKQHLDKLHEHYVKNPEECIKNMLTRGSAKNILFMNLFILMELYGEGEDADIKSVKDLFPKESEKWKYKE